MVVRSALDDESIAGVELYLYYDEYEMVFEILFIEIIKPGKVPAIDLRKSREVARLVKLNKDSAFDLDFGKKLENYIPRNSSCSYFF